MNINYIIELKTDRLLGSRVIPIKSKRASRQGNQWQLSEWQQLTALNFPILYWFLLITNGDIKKYYITTYVGGKSEFQENSNFPRKILNFIKEFLRKRIFFRFLIFFVFLPPNESLITIFPPPFGMANSNFPAIQFSRRHLISPIVIIIDFLASAGGTTWHRIYLRVIFRPISFSQHKCGQASRREQAMGRTLYSTILA